MVTPHHSARPEIRQQARTQTLPDGRRVTIIDAVIPDGATELVREGLARRALCNSTGACPCGATVRLSRAQRRNLKPGTVTHVVIEHEADCPAGDQVLTAALRAWQEAGR